VALVIVLVVGLIEHISVRIVCKVTWVSHAHVRWWLHPVTFYVSLLKCLKLKLLEAVDWETSHCLRHLFIQVGDFFAHSHLYLFFDHSSDYWTEVRWDCIKIIKLLFRKLLSCPILISLLDRYLLFVGRPISELWFSVSIWIQFRHLQLFSLLPFGISGLCGLFSLLNIV